MKYMYIANSYMLRKQLLNDLNSNPLCIRLNRQCVVKLINPIYGQLSKQLYGPLYNINDIHTALNYNV